MSEKAMMQRMAETAEFRAIVHHEDGSYWADVPECPGLFATGENLEELAEALAEAWAMWHDDRNRPVNVIECGLKPNPTHEVNELHVRVPLPA